MTDTGVRRRTNGRSARLRQAVIESTLGLLVEQGVDQVTVAKVAERAGVHETSIYRRWGTPEKLMLDAVLGLSDSELPVPDSGSLRSDLIALAAELCTYMDTPLGLAVAQLLVSTSNDPTFQAMQSNVWQQRLAAAGTVVDRAIARGEVAAGTDPTFVVELLVAPIHFRVLVLHEPLEPGLPVALADAILHGIAKQPK